MEKIEDTKSDRFKTLTISGQKMGIESEKVKDFKEGMSIDYEIEKKGQFTNVTSIKVDLDTPEPKKLSIQKPAKDFVKECIIEAEEIYRELLQPVDAGDYLDWPIVLQIADQIRRTRLCEKI